ncbi:MAG: AAA family ATPase [Caldilineaceae bacterium]
MIPKPVQASTYTFRDIIEGGFLYVDKTRYIYELIRYSKGVYFLSRPRRFGKSLMISTLEEIFQGNKALFQGLWLYASDYNWQTYPIIRMDFSRLQVNTAAELKVGIERYLGQIAQQYNVTLGAGPYYAQLEDLILALAKEKKVVILIDEYDKPLIDALPNLNEALQIRDILKGFYTLLKAMDQYIRFVFITGISKVDLFSAMNNLDDLSMDRRFAAALGITETELRRDFQEHIDAFAQRLGISQTALLQQIREWYNGFYFAHAGESVYNPYSTLQLFNKQAFASYWFESGTPTFLIKLVKEQGYDVQRLDQLQLSELSFSSYDLEKLDVLPLLFQNGYLTIKGYNLERQLYQLGYPNQEVENAFLVYLLAGFSAVPRGLSESYLWQLLDALKAHKFDDFFMVLNVFFANIDYDLHLDYEKYYQTIFYLIFLLLGVHVTAEVKTNQGRIDAVIELPQQIYLFEFKLSGSAATALKQIKENEYHQKYQLRGKPLTLIGARFDRKKRKVSEWKSALKQP